MSGIIGFSNLKQNLDNEKSKLILLDMSKKNTECKYNKDDCFIKEHVCLLDKDISNNKQPMTYKLFDNTYTIVYNGRLYNTKELKKELKENGFSFETYSDTEILIKAYIHWGYDIIHKLNGIFGFAIWDEKKQELFVARDHFGVKPFYYTILEDTFIFSSEIKSILKFPRN